MIDIGAILFLAGLMLIIRGLIKGENNGLSLIVMIVGGILMIVDYYIIQGNTSFVSNAIF